LHPEKGLVNCGVLKPAILKKPCDFDWWRGKMKDDGKNDIKSEIT